MPPKRTARTARVAAATATAAAAATPMTTAAIEQLVTGRVSAALANHETLQNSTNDHGDGSPILALEPKGLRALRKALKKLMMVKYCPRGEIKKLEIELSNLKVKGTDIPSYTLRFQELALMCGRMFPEESDEVEKYVSGLPDMIWGNVMQVEQKRKIEFNAGNNQGYQQQNKRQNTGRAYTAGSGEKREYTGSLP
ncbi:hypothetical protein Tco_1426609, partial [Tanacetum coccineum]